MTNSADPDKKPTDLDLHCLQMQIVSVFSRTSVTMYGHLNFLPHLSQNWNSYILQTTLFIPTLDTTTKFVKMTISLSQNRRFRSYNDSLMFAFIKLYEIS